MRSASDSGGGRIRGIGRYFWDVWNELRKVIWPTRQEVTKFTIVVLIAMIAVAIFIYIVDMICTAGATHVFPTPRSQ